MKFNLMTLPGMNIMSRWLHITCQDTSPLISEMMDHSLPFSKRWRVKLHLAICEFCNYYKEQLEIIGILVHRLGEEEAPIYPEAKLSPEAKEKISKQLNASRKD